MRNVISAGLFYLVVSSSALAQQTQVYSPLLQLDDRMNGDLRLIEQAEGTKISSATADLCFAFGVDNTTGVHTLRDFDRVVIPLKIEGNRFSGNATSTEGKRPVAVNFERRAGEGGRLTLSGSVSVDGQVYPISKDPAFGKDPEEESAPFLVVAKPQVFDETAAPNTVAIKYRRQSLPDLLEMLRSANARIELTSSALDKCGILRSGFDYLRVTTPPDEAQALVSKLRKLPYVIDAGWTSPFSASPAVRIGDSRWVTKGVLDRGKAAGELSQAIAKHIGATVAGSEWDAQTGELKVRLKRPSRLFPGLGLTETFQAVALIAPGRFGETGRAMIWGPLITGDIVDDRPAPRLSIVPLALYAGPQDGIVINIEPEVLGGLLQSEWLDSSSGAWTRR
jgi:hypothetical protein